MKLKVTEDITDAGQSIDGINKYKEHHRRIFLWTAYIYEQKIGSPHLVIPCIEYMFVYVLLSICMNIDQSKTR